MLNPAHRPNAFARLRRLRALACAMIAATALTFVGVGASSAQDKQAMIRLLRGADDFRARVQAAFALGNTGDASVRPHLERALRDSNAAVRAAAATALGRLGSRAALPALRRARDDSSASVRMQVQRAISTLRARPGQQVAPSHAARTPGSSLYPSVAVVPEEGRIPWPRIRYVVVLGDMGNSAEAGGPALAQRLRAEVTRHLRLLRGVAVFPRPGAVDENARRQIRRRRLPFLRLEGNVTEVERSAQRRDVSVRCAVSLMLLDEPDRSLRGVLNGAATGTEPRTRRSRDRGAQQQRLATQALEAAVRSAMRTAATAISRSAR